MNPAGFLAFSTLKNSPIASILALPNSGKLRETRRFSCVRHAPRPQFHVLQSPISLTLALPSAFSPSKAYAFAGMSFRSLFLFVSRPSVIDTGSGDRNRKIGDTVKPFIWKMPASVPWCRASVREVGPITRGSS